MADKPDYSTVVGGALKLKGKRLRAVGEKKKKHKKKHRHDDEAPADAGEAASGTGAGDAKAESKLIHNEDEEFKGLTPTEIKFIKRKREKLLEEAKKMAGKSYRQKIEEMNKYLAALPVHNDIPKIAAAGLG